METKQDAGVVFPLLAAFASPLLLSQRVFKTFAGFEDTLRKLVGARALVSIWSAAVSLLPSSGRRDDLGVMGTRGWRVKFSQDAATSAIVLLTRNGACSGELDGGGRAKMVKFIIQSDCHWALVVTSLNQLEFVSDCHWFLPGVFGTQLLVGTVWKR